MPMEELVQADFSGGVTGRRPATDFSERQLAEAKGFLLQTETMLRSQWHLEVLDVGGTPTELAAFDDLIMFGIGTQFSTLQEPVPSGRWPSETAVATVDTGGVVLSGEVALRPVDGAWRNGILLNGPDRASSAALFAYGSGAGATTWQVVESGFATEGEYPTSGTRNGIPQANVATMWGDYMVLGDIEWANDSEAPYSSTNRQKYPHGLWFSRPGEPARFGQPDVEWMGQWAGSGNRVVGIFPMPNGALVLTTSLTVLLRGTPSSHEYVELRRGVSPQHRHAACWWPDAGVAAWVDENGRIWHTDGAEVSRLDEVLPAATTGDGAKIGAWGPYLVAYVDGRWWAFRLLESGSEGAWTELSTDLVPTTQLVGTESGLYFGSASGIGRWSPNYGARGTQDETNTPLPLTLRSRTFAEQPHRETWWHSFGLQAEGGQVDEARWLTSQDDPGWVASGPNPVALSGRGDWSWPAAGPSREGVAQFVLSGDVSIEAVTARFHAGRDSR